MLTSHLKQVLRSQKIAFFKFLKLSIKSRVIVAYLSRKFVARIFCKKMTYNANFTFDVCITDNFLFVKGPRDKFFLLVTDLQTTSFDLIEVFEIRKLQGLQSAVLSRVMLALHIIFFVFC